MTSRLQPFTSRPETLVDAERFIQMLNTILSATTEYVSMLDRQGRYLFASEKGLQLSGMQPGDILGKTWQELELPAELGDIRGLMEAFDAHRRRVMATGRPVTGEIALPLAGQTRCYEYVAKPVFDSQGDVEAVIVSSRDVTERKRSEEARYQTIVESSSEAIYSKDLQGVLTSWNRSAERLFGYTAEEVLGHSVFTLVPPDRTQEQEDILERIKAGQAVERYETARLRKDGTRITVSVAVSPLRDAGGEIVGSSTISLDITEQKRLLEELETRGRELERTNRDLRQQSEELTQANAALEEANRVRSQFLSTMSHELRTPLASIIGFCQLLVESAEGAGWNARDQRNLERILKNAQHLLGLINQVLDLAKIEVGRMNTDKSQIDVRELLTSVVEETQSIALAQHLVLRAEVEEGVDFLESDPLKLRQILLNLASNALKFTEQGEVLVSARRVRVPGSGADHIALAVKDTGMGIPADVQAHIFEPFYQADGSNTRKFGGTGLGLSIVSQLTTLLGGNVEVTSSPGQGSTFTVILPLRTEDEQGGRNDQPLSAMAWQSLPRLLPLAAPQLVPEVLQELSAGAIQQEGSSPAQKRLLVVDDNPDTVLLVKEALEQTPYEVIGVQDPLHVLELVQTMRPYAITLDVMMPNLNGWQLLYQLKSDPATIDVPVIMLTILSERTTGYVLGADEYLIKPFDRTTLLKTLERLDRPAVPARSGIEH